MALKLEHVITAMSGLRNPYSYPRFQVKDFSFTIAPGIKSVYYRTTVLGDNDSYTVHIQLFDINFSKEEQKGWIKSSISGKDWWFKPFDIISRCKLKCQCMDSRFMWEYPMYKKASLIGAFRKYKRVPGSNRPPKNPDNIPGFCKHIWSAIHKIKVEGHLSGI